MKRLIFVAMLMLVGCGGSDIAQSGHAQMLGTWNGQATATGGTLTGQIVLPAHVTITRVPLAPGQPNDAVLLHGFCPDGNGAAFVSGQETSVVSGSTIECPDAAIGSCADTYIVYSTVTADLSAGALHVEALGFANGCGATSAFGLDIIALPGS